MMTRCEIFNNKIDCEFKEFVKEEIKIRAAAAKTLREEFDCMGIHIANDLNADGGITVYEGMAKLAECLGVSLYRKSEKNICFDCAGVTFTYTDYLDKFKDVSTKENKKHQEYDDEFFGKKAAG